MAKFGLIALMVVMAAIVLFPKFMFNHLIYKFHPNGFPRASKMTGGEGDKLIQWMLRIFFAVMLGLIIYGLTVSGWPS